MASEKVDLTVKGYPEGNEVNDLGSDDVELRGHGNHAPSAEPSNREILEVRLLKCIKRDRTER